MKLENPVTVPDSTVPNPTPLQQRPSPNSHDIACVPEMDSIPETRTTSVGPQTTPSADAYNWRKYGQKQVKYTESSRSYYRCTHNDCHAKKMVLRHDESGVITEVVYKGTHHHEVPQKGRFTKLKQSLSSSGPIAHREDLDSPVKKVDEIDSVMNMIEPREVSDSSGSDETICVKAEVENADESECKQGQDVVIAGIESKEEKRENVTSEPSRMEESEVTYSAPLFRMVKDPKIVVHAAGDVGVTSDGYRWRKYGQKNVKGSPYPRSYYRCTTIGCSVRKHVERAKDDAGAVVVAYEGTHNHDIPEPRKRRGPPSAGTLVPATSEMENLDCKKLEKLPNRRPSTPCPMDLDGEKALESARTLLSMAIEPSAC